MATPNGEAASDALPNTEVAGGIDAPETQNTTTNEPEDFDAELNRLNLQEQDIRQGKLPGANATEEPEATDETDAEETATEGEEIQDAGEETDLDQPPVSKQYRVRTADPKMGKLLNLLRENGSGADIFELARQAGFSEAKAEAAAQQAQAEVKQQEQAPAEPLKPLQDKLATLRAERARLAEAYEPTQKIQDEIEDTIAELAEARANARVSEVEKRITSEQAGRVERSFNANMEKVKTAHPLAVQEGTVQAAIALSIRTSLLSKNPELANDPGLPLRIIQEAETRFPEQFPKRSKVTPASTAAPRTAIPAQQPRANGRPMGEAVAATNGGRQPISREDVIRNIDNLSFEDAAALAHKLK